MPQAQGANSSFIMQLEDTFKTEPAAVGATKMHFDAENLNMSQTTIDAPTLGYNPDKPAKGNKEGSGSVKMSLQAYMDIMWRWAIGGVTITGAGPYTKVFKNAATLPSALMETAFLDLPEYKRCLGCTSNGFSLTVPVEGFVSVEFPLLFARETWEATCFDCSPTDTGKSLYDMANLAVIEEGGVTLCIGTEYSIQYETNLDGNSYTICPTNQFERYAIPRGKSKVSGTINALFTSMTLLNKAINNTETSLKAKWQFGTGIGTTGNESTEIYIPELILERNSPIIDETAEGIMVKLNFVGYYDNDAGGSPIIITTKNTLATV